MNGANEPTAGWGSGAQKVCLEWKVHGKGVVPMQGHGDIRCRFIRQI